MSGLVVREWTEPPTVDDMLPAVPSGWRQISSDELHVPNGVVPGARGWMIGQVRVIVSVDDCEDEGVWLHTSVSRRANGRVHIPTWNELSMVKQIVHGDRYAIQILPPKRQYVNLTEALHLWERLDQATIPQVIGSRS